MPVSSAPVSKDIIDEIVRALKTIKEPTFQNSVASVVRAGKTVSDSGERPSIFVASSPGPELGEIDEAGESFATLTITLHVRASDVDERKTDEGETNLLELLYHDIQHALFVEYDSRDDTELPSVKGMSARAFDDDGATIGFDVDVEFQYTIRRATLALKAPL